MLKYIWKYFLLFQSPVNHSFAKVFLLHILFLFLFLFCNKEWPILLLKGDHGGFVWVPFHGDFCLYFYQIKRDNTSFKQWKLGWSMYRTYLTRHFMWRRRTPLLPNWKLRKSFLTCSAIDDARVSRHLD